MKPWRVSTPDDEEDFATEAEALVFAATYLQFCRDEAFDNGEWPDDVEMIRIYKLTHFAGITVSDDDGVEYGIISAPVEV
jgi:hypothetical protein